MTHTIPAQVPFSTGRNLPQLTIPAGACDAHHHIFDPVKFEYRKGDTSNIPPATVACYRMLKKRFGFDRNVIVTPSAYGYDNRCTLDALTHMGSSARAVIAICELPSREELQFMHRLGVRGIRFAISSDEDFNEGFIRRCAKALSLLGWHICFWIKADLIVQFQSVLESLECQIVFDHRGQLPADKGITHPAFDIMSTLMQQHRAWVKISSAYQDSIIGAPHYSDNIAIGRAFVEACASRILWGSDWPHPSEYINKREMPNDVSVLDLLAEQAPTTELVEQILVANPAKLYGFDT
ncbi:amidohydrolase family protein [Vibrio ezurae]|uniref:Putative amidohydrolase n=1 Tax=Vibrio ezurae NBRC 102218 TaxID=1219080 RepID=U3AH93_9VIBR|nr:amidohydrolase family protein [Vibrio ezurae]GAD79281.1 putative amidohydrolase [Vibrio ezurae NBRC 102218]